MPFAAPSATATGRTGGLENLGVVSKIEGLQITLVDAAHRRAYGHYFSKGTERVVELDLDRQVKDMVRRDVPLQTEIASVSPGQVFKPATVTLDSRRRRALYLDWGPAGVNQFCPQSLIRTLDLATLGQVGAPLDLNERLPGFYAQGITYSSQDRRVYLTGILGCEGFLLDFASAPAVPVTIIALDAQTGQLAWATTLTKCLHAMSTALGGGSSIYRSEHLPALYVGCIRPESIVGASYPGQSGIDRIWLDPRAENPIERFQEEFFAISGNYTSTQGLLGQLLYDSGSERLFAATHSQTTPGVWIFDGKMSAWVGFVPAATESNSPIGVDQSTGHLFMRSGDDAGKGISEAIIVSDARQTPVPQGARFEFVSKYGYVTWVVDPIRHLLFAQGEIKTDAQSLTRTFVFQDKTPTLKPALPEDYDGLTSDHPEGPRTLSTYSGTLASYGVNLVYVGGIGGTTAPLYQNPFTNDQDIVPRNSLISAGDRGATIASVSFLDVRNIGATATAQQIAPDTSTENDRRTYQNQVATVGNPYGQGAATAEVASLLDWPWPAAMCLDAGGDPKDPGTTAPGGASSTHCNLDKLQASASAAESAVQTEGISIASSSAIASAAKEASGLVTTTAATVRGLVIDVPSQGSLRIGVIRLEVRTTAHGRPGTAKVSWTREIKDVTLIDANGSEVFACAVCDADALAKQVNELFDVKLKMRVPSPEITQTAKGAFAGFQKNEADHVNDVVALNESANSRIMPALQLEIYNDFQDRSRLVLQLAGIQASSTYGITPLAGEPPVDVIPPIPTIGPVPQPPFVAPPPSIEPPTDQSGGILRRITTTARFLVRSPKDALLVGLTGMLFLGMAAFAVRRRQLNALTIGRRPS
jgi:hypothetical protein